MQSIANQIWSIIPAAGSGTRMRADQPKQYLPLNGVAVIDHSLEVILAESRVDKALVGIKQGSGCKADLAVITGYLAISAVRSEQIPY